MDKLSVTDRYVLSKFKSGKMLGILSQGLRVSNQKENCKNPL